MGMKEAYQQKIRAQLDKWSAEIEKLKAGAENTDADTRIKYQKKIQELRTMQEKAEKKLDELKESRGEAWEDLKSGIEEAKDALGKALQSAKSRFK